MQISEVSEEGYISHFCQIGVIHIFRDVLYILGLFYDKTNRLYKVKWSEKSLNLNVSKMLN